MRQNIIGITRIEIQEAVKQAAPQGLREAFRAGFSAARKGFMAPTEEEAWAAGCEAVYLVASEEDKARIEEELKALSSFGAFLNGLPIDVERIQVPAAPIGIRALFLESGAS